MNDKEFAGMMLELAEIAWVGHKMQGIEEMWNDES